MSDRHAVHRCDAGSRSRRASGLLNGQRSALPLRPRRLAARDLCPCRASSRCRFAADRLSWSPFDSAPRTNRPNSPTPTLQTPQTPNLDSASRRIGEFGITPSMTADERDAARSEKRILYAEQDAECRPSARQMMCAALNDAAFDWGEAERLANLRDFQVLSQLRALREELSHA